MRLKRIVALTLIGFFVSASEVYATMPKTANEQNETMKARWNIEEEIEKDCNCYGIDVEMSFYTSLIEENTSYGSVDAQGNPLTFGTIAIPRDIALGTRLHINNVGDFVGRDRGSRKHIRIKEDGTWRIDVFIPRIKGETDNQYWRRVNNYGKVKERASVYCDNCLNNN